MTFQAHYASLAISMIAFRFHFVIVLFLLFVFLVPSLARADVIETVDTIYQQAENNGIAEAICKAIDMGKIFMVPLFAIMFCIYGFRAFQGDGAKWSTFITFAIGMTAYNTAGTFLEWFMPKMGLEYGCKCAVERDIRDVNGIIKTYPTGLNYDCSNGMNDYYSVHGLSSDGNNTTATILQKKEQLSGLQNVVSNYEKLFNEVNDLSNKISQKQSEVQANRAAYDSAEQIYKAYQETDVLNQYNELKSAVSVKKTTLDQAQLNYDNVSSQLKSVNSQIDSIQRKIVSQEKAIKIAESNYNDANAILEAYRTQQNINQSSLDAFTNIANNANSVLKQEQNKLEDYKTQLANLEAQKAGTEGLEFQVASAKTALNTAKEEYNTATKNVSMYETKNEMKMYLKVKNDLSTIKQKYNASTTEHNSLVLKWQVKKQKLDSMTAEYEDAKTRIPALQIEISNLSST